MNSKKQNDKIALITKVGIIIIISIILFLWLATLRGVFENQKEYKSNTWKKISADMDKSLKEASSQFDKAANLASSSTNKAFVNELLDKASSTATSTVATTTAVEIKKEILDLIKPAPTSSPKRSGCPEYINCMPSIGEARPCIVPVGCEKITQIAY